jgi:RluA family pseudouridine synthase
LIPVLYQDEHILVVNKPPGLLTIPDGYHRELPDLKDLLTSGFKRVWTVHRLDKCTSGIVIFALTPLAHRNLCIQFEKRSLHKTYLALIQGVLPKDTLIIDTPLKINGDRRHRTVPNLLSGKPALTEIVKQKTSPCFTLITAEPKTGYLHQIRAHLSYIGHPIVNDFLYGFKSLPDQCDFPAARLMLHALSISLKHPFSEAEMVFESPIPEEFSFLD